MNKLFQFCQKGIGISDIASFGTGTYTALVTALGIEPVAAASAIMLLQNVVVIS